MNSTVRPTLLRVVSFLMRGILVVGAYMNIIVRPTLHRVVSFFIKDILVVSFLLRGVSVPHLSVMRTQQVLLTRESFQ